MAQAVEPPGEDRLSALPEALLLRVICAVGRSDAEQPAWLPEHLCRLRACSRHADGGGSGSGGVRAQARGCRVANAVPPAVLVARSEYAPARG